MHRLSFILFGTFLGTLVSLAVQETPAPPLLAFPLYEVADPTAREVTVDNLLASERFWPYLVALTEPMKSPGNAHVLPTGLAGVLIRVENDKTVRLDMGRDGLLLLPVAQTDLLARANAIRLGQATKTAPNLMYALGTRLVDSSADRLLPLGVDVSGGKTAYLCVFSTVGEELERLSADLKRLPTRSDLLTIFFPQVQQHDAQTRERLRELEWPVPFVYDHMAESYARGLLPAESKQPMVMLLSPEGRIHFAAEWRPGALERLIPVYGSLSKSKD